MTNKICEGKAKEIWKMKTGSVVWSISNINTPERKGIKRIRIKCELCGRRILSSIKINHDGDYIIHYLPPHKTKGWWKKKKILKEKKCFIKRII